MPAPESVRSPHAVGRMVEPGDSPDICAARKIAVAIDPSSATTHTMRRKRTVRMYSTPSGHAVTISTMLPSSTARPSAAIMRDNPSGPPTFGAVDSSVPVPVVGATVTGTVSVGVSVDPVAGSTVGAVVVAVVAGSPVIVNEIEACPFELLSGALTSTST